MTDADVSSNSAVRVCQLYSKVDNHFGGAFISMSAAPLRVWKFKFMFVGLMFFRFFMSD